MTSTGNTVDKWNEEKTNETDELQRTMEGEATTKETSSKEEEEEITVKTVYEAKTNNRTSRCHKHLKFKFPIIAFIPTTSVYMKQQSIYVFIF